MEISLYLLKNLFIEQIINNVYLPCIFCGRYGQYWCQIKIDSKLKFRILITFEMSGSETKRY